MKRYIPPFILSAVVSGVLLSPAAVRAEDQALLVSLPEEDAYPRYEFSYAVLAGFERKRLGAGMKVKGWQVGQRIYFGQTRVGDRWGPGVVYQNGNTAYGINYQGVQITTRF